MAGTVVDYVVDGSGGRAHCVESFLWGRGWYV